MKHNQTVKQFLSLILVLMFVIPFSGCAIRKSHVETKKVLVEAEDDVTEWVEDGITTSEYETTTKVRNDGNSSSIPSSSRSSSVEDDQSEEETDFKMNYAQYQSGNSSGYLLKLSDYIKNTSVQAPRYLFSNHFLLDSGLNSGWGTPLNKTFLENTIKKHDLGSSQVKIYGDVREWGYNFFMSANQTSGNGSRKGGGGYPIMPTARKVAYQMLKNGVFELYNIHIANPWESCPGHLLWQHYSCEWGADSICAEVGESISSTQTHIAFTRGAAKQYSLPWALQFSFWHQGYIKDYTGLKVWGNWSTPIGGHSPSLYRRTFLAAYMGGASHFYPESGLSINYLNELESDKTYKLSPVGETTKELNRFAKRNPDVGIEYVPFGLVLDFYHGMYPGDYTTLPKRAFQAFRYDAGDEMNFDLLDLFFPNSWIVKTGKEENYHVNGPYGDTCDVLLQNASQEVLNSYPYLILSGSIAFSKEEIARYRSYVKQGGTLILNTAYLADFPEWEHQYDGEDRCDLSVGKGTVIIYGPDFEIKGLDSIIREKLAESVPFTFSKEVEYLVNIKNGSWIVTMINNKGFTSDVNNGEKIDDSKTIDLKLTYTGNLVPLRVTELWSGQNMPASKEQNVTITPGDVKIFEFYFR